MRIWLTHAYFEWNLEAAWSDSYVEPPLVYCTHQRQAGSILRLISGGCAHPMAASGEVETLGRKPILNFILELLFWQ